MKHLGEEQFFLAYISNVVTILVRVGLLKQKHASTILTRYGMDGSRDIDTLIEFSKDLDISALGWESKFGEATMLPYCKGIGSLTYLMTGPSQDPSTV